MLRMKFIVGIVGLGVGLSSASAADWPQYMGPNRDGVWTETGIIDKFPEGGPKVKWRTPIKAGYTGPAVVGGKVFVMDRVLAEGAKNHAEPIPHRPADGIPGTERVLCFDAADGKLVWKHEYDCPYKVSYPAGPRCTPTVVDGMVYTLGTEGNLCCLKASSGEVVWKKDFAKDYGAKTPLWGHSAHPLVDGNKLYCVVGGDGSVAVCFDKNTGKEIWKNLSAREQGYCAPIIYQVGGKPQLIIWHAESVNGLDPETGKQLWSEDAKTYMGMSIATPRLSGERLFITAYPAMSMMLGLSADGKSQVKWKGEKKNSMYSVFSTPHFFDGHVYGTDSGGFLTCIKADTGERLWRTLQPHGPKAEGSAEVFLVKNDDNWFLNNEKGDLIMAKISPKGYEEICRAHLLEPDGTAFGRNVVWSHPAYAEKCAFMRNDKELICVDLGK